MYLRCLLVFLLLIVQPVTAFAYSYGDPNKEDVAETYKEIAAKLEKSPEDWAGAISAYNARKAEIVLEFGQSISDTIESNLNNKQKDLVLHNYRAVLAKNVERRLKSVEDEFNDYAKAKLMLAKGRGTFLVLEPFVTDAAAKKVYAAFDKALTALGNPGLFGVGVVAPDKQAFLSEKNLVMSTLAPLSAVKTAAAPAKQEPAQPAATQPAKPAQASAGTAKPAANKPAQATAPATQQAPAAQANTASAATSPQAATPPAKTAEPAATAEQKPAAETPAAGTTAPAATVPPAQTSPEATPPVASSTAQETAPQESAAPQPATGSPADTTTQSAAAPADAPAESKVNPAVTVGVIGGILVIAGGAFWIGKRKGLL